MMNVRIGQVQTRLEEMSNQRRIYLLFPKSVGCLVYESVLMLLHVANILRLLTIYLLSSICVQLRKNAYNAYCAL